METAARDFVSQRSPGSLWSLLSGIWVVAAGLLTASCAFAGSGGVEQPNFLVIVTDDQGYGDFSFTGNRVLETPHIDRLAAESVRFERFFVHTVCAPTRASFMTGRHFFRVGVWGVHEGRSSLNREVPTLADGLAEAGYHTAMVGKWHLGTAPGYEPWRRGFSEVLEGVQYNNDRPYALRSAQGQTVIEGGWTQETLTKEALRMLKERPKDRPFFLYAAYNAPHHPWVAPEDLVKKYLDKGLHEETARCYGEIEHLDRAVGTLLEGLEKSGAAKDTVVVFFSDNGPHQGDIPAADWEGRNPQGFRGQKGNVYDNGVRVPLLVRWPGVLEPRIVSTRAVFVADMLPTMFELAGVAMSGWQAPLDGRSFVPLLHGGDEGDWPERFVVDSWFNPVWEISGGDRMPPRESLVFEEQRLSVRDERYKLVQPGKTAAGIGELELFDTLADPREATNLAADDSERTLAMAEMLKAWWKETAATDAAFRKPEIVIGFDGEQRGECKTVEFSQWLGGVGGWHRHENFRMSGDGFAGPVTVATPGRYRFSLLAGGNVEGVKFRLSIGDKVWEGEAAREGQVVQLGELDLMEAGEFPLKVVLTHTPEGTGIPDLYRMMFERVENP